MTRLVIHGEFAVAPLKEVAEVFGDRHLSGVIHGEFAVAPLKERNVDRADRVLRVIHGEFAVAPLKDADAWRFQSVG